MAGKRNYQPTLRALLHTILRFIVRYAVALEAGMTTDQASALATFQSAAELLQIQLGDPRGD